VDRPLLSLDRPFTYRLPSGSQAGVGSLVRVPFHGKLTRGWILGPAEELGSRTLSVKTVVSQVRYFDEGGLALARWIGERYVAPLAAVLGRMTPPRTASEEAAEPPVAPSRPHVQPVASALRSYHHGDELMAALSDATAGGFLVRPAPEDEVTIIVEAVTRCLAAGRQALVIVPEADPVPATAARLAEEFGPRVAVFLGGSPRLRYRMWLSILRGAHDVVVGSRPAVFAPLTDLGLVAVSRESHPAHREDRAPYYHVRDVALARARHAGAVCLLSAVCPSSEAAGLGLTAVSPSTRRWPPVEVVKPGLEGRAPRLIKALSEARRGFIYSPVPGAGIAAVCRVCGQPAACAVCGGVLRSQEGLVSCIVCEAPGRCANCGAADFGLRRGGAERVHGWAERAASVPVHRLRDGETPRLPAPGEIIVGGPDDVRDFGPGALDLVAILDADLAERRPGLTARERALTTWMEAIGWARPAGRAIVQATRANDPAVQAMVRGNPDRFHRDEATRRREAGFPVGAAVFRVAGTGDLPDRLQGIVEPITFLISAGGPRTVCLLALQPGQVPSFGRAIRELAVAGIVERVEAEPHL
jgi:primosomal protein N' (replication factor Y) (superfamily II helicase)